MSLHFVHDQHLWGYYWLNLVPVYSDYLELKIFSPDTVYLLKHTCDVILLLKVCIIFRKCALFLGNAHFLAR